MPPRACPLTGATGAAAQQHGLLLVQFETAHALHRKLQHLEGGAVQVKELAAFLAHQVHLFFAAAGARVAVLQLVVLSGAHDLYAARLFEPRKVPVDGTERNIG